MDEHRAAAIEFLENLQRDHWEQKDIEIDRDERIQKLFIAINESIGGNGEITKAFELDKIARKKEMFSKFESVEAFMILSRIVEGIETVLAEAPDAEVSKKIFFGSLSTGDVNGVAINFDNPGYFIILIDDGVFGFANLLAKALAQSFPYKGIFDENLQFSVKLDEVKQRLVDKPEIGGRLVDLILGYVVGGNPHKAKPYLPPRELIGLVSAWRDVMEYFILGHEFGHARLGHLNSQSRQLIARDGFDEIPLSWEQEFEADLFGLFIAAMLQKTESTRVLVMQESRHFLAVLN